MTTYPPGGSLAVMSDLFVSRSSRHGASVRTAGAIEIGARSMMFCTAACRLSHSEGEM